MSAALDTIPMFDTRDDTLVEFARELVRAAKASGEVTMSLPQCAALCATAEAALADRRRTIDIREPISSAAIETIRAVLMDAEEFGRDLPDGHTAGCRRLLAEWEAQPRPTNERESPCFCWAALETDAAAALALLPESLVGGSFKDSPAPAPPRPAPSVAGEGHLVAAPGPTNYSAVEVGGSERGTSAALCSGASQVGPAVNPTSAASPPAPPSIGGAEFSEAATPPKVNAEATGDRTQKAGESGAHPTAKGARNPPVSYCKHGHLCLDDGGCHPDCLLCDEADRSARDLALVKRALEAAATEASYSYGAGGAASRIRALDPAAIVREVS